MTRACADDRLGGRSPWGVFRWGLSLRDAWLGGIALLAAISSASVAGVASAQSIDIPAALAPDPKAPPTVATLQYGHQFETDVEDDGTEMARDNAFFGLVHRTRLGEKTSLFSIGSYTLHAYDFSGASAPSNAYRWDDVHRLVLGGLVGHDVNDRWRLIGGALVRSWGEGGADFGKTITGGLIAGFDYHPSDDFSVGLLVGVFSALEDSAGLLPVPTLKWQFAEGLRLNVGMVSVFDPGVGGELSWQLTDAVSLGTGFAFQTRRFRLSDGSRVKQQAPGNRNRFDGGGVGEETELPVFAQLRWRPTPKSAVDLLGGVAFAGHLRVEDRDGGRIADDSYEAAGFLGLKGQIFF